MQEIKKVPCEVYSRIVGYFRPTRNWNKGKLQEFQERRVYIFPEESLEEAPAHENQRARQNLSD